MEMNATEKKQGLGMNENMMIQVWLKAASSLR